MYYHLKICMEVHISNTDVGKFFRSGSLHHKTKLPNDQISYLYTYSAASAKRL